MKRDTLETLELDRLFKETCLEWGMSSTDHNKLVRIMNMMANIAYNQGYEDAAEAAIESLRRSIDDAANK